VRKLLSALKDGPRTPSELRTAIGVQHRQTFRENYLNPAIRADLICAEDGLSPHDPRIRYALTDKGTSTLNEVAEKQAIDTGKPSVEPEKQPIGGEELHIGTEELHIGMEKLHIESALTKLDITQPTKENILKLIQSFGTVEIFGRSEVCKATGLQERAASYLIGKMLRHRLLDAVTGHGKGKYRFRSFDNGDTAK
jgi:hypothetical protein